MTPQLAEYFGAKNGLLVSAVTTDSPAARAGLKVGDVIVSVENRPVNARRDLVQALRDARDGQALTIGIVRDKRETTVNVTPASRRAPM
jgi:S1-C subfamily serine protease